MIFVFHDSSPSSSKIINSNQAVLVMEVGVLQWPPVLKWPLEVIPLLPTHLDWPPFNNKYSVLSPIAAMTMALTSMSSSRQCLNLAMLNHKWGEWVHVQYSRSVYNIYYSVQICCGFPVQWRSYLLHCGWWSLQVHRRLTHLTTSIYMAHLLIL